MARIAIKDLTQSVDLDREAMATIRGGARIRGHQAGMSTAILRSSRLFDYPPGVSNTRAAPPASNKRGTSSG